MWHTKHLSATLIVFGILTLVIISHNCSQKNNNDLEKKSSPEFVKVVDGLNFPEGPAWDGKGMIYVSNCYGGWITRIESETTSIFLRALNDPFTFDKTNGLTVFKDGSLFACDFGRGAILRIQPDGRSEIYADNYQGKRFNRPNDLAFDRGGNLYFTDPNAYRTEDPDGVIYRIDANSRQVAPVASGLAFPNGLAFSADAKFLYVCESAPHQISKFQITLDGYLINKKVFVELPGGDPDGINFDQAGNLYVAHFGGAAIYVVAPDGTIKQKLPAPGKKPSNVEFGGNDLQTLYITEVETNAVYKMRVSQPGLPLFSSPSSISE